MENPQEESSSQSGSRSMLLYFAPPIALSAQRSAEQLILKPNSKTELKNWSCSDLHWLALATGCPTRWASSDLLLHLLPLGTPLCAHWCYPSRRATRLWSISATDKSASAEPWLRQKCAACHVCGDARTTSSSDPVQSDSICYDSPPAAISGVIWGGVEKTEILERGEPRRLWKNMRWVDKYCDLCSNQGRNIVS